MAEVAVKIIALLRSLEKSPRWLSQQTGIPYTNLQESLQGRRLWRIGELEKVAKALNTTPEHII